MSNAQVHRAFLPNQSDVYNAPQEFLNDLFHSRSRNIEIVDQKIQGRLGLIKFSSTRLYGQIKKVYTFNKYNKDSYLLFLTSKDIYSYDFSNSRFDILTPVYTTGTIEIKFGAPDVVLGAGTAWLSNLKAGDRIKIGAAGIHTGSTWYVVESVDSDTQITLTTNAAVTAAGTFYVATACFSLEQENFWDCETFQDAALGETFIATDGLTTPVRWNAVNQVIPLTGLPDSMKAKFVKTLAGRLIFSNTVEGGNNQPQRKRWSGVANCQSYNALDFNDFVDEATGISGTCIFGNYEVTFKTDCIYVGRFVEGDYVFDWERASFGEGCRSHQSIVVRKEGIYYYGSDKKFHCWNLQNDNILTESIFPETKNFDPNLDEFVAGEDFPRKNQVRWFCPHSTSLYNNYVVVYDYKLAVTKVWEYSQDQACASIGQYVEQNDLYVDDSVSGEYYVDEQDGYWDDSSFVSGAPIQIYGGYDGYIRKCDVGYDDDGVEYTRSLALKRFNFDLPENFKRLWRQQFWIEAETSGDILVKVRLNDENGYNSATKTISLTEVLKDIIKRTITWDKRGQNFQFSIESTKHFALIGIITWYFKKRRTN